MPRSSQKKTVDTDAAHASLVVAAVRTLDAELISVISHSGDSAASAHAQHWRARMHEIMRDLGVTIW